MIRDDRFLNKKGWRHKVFSYLRMSFIEHETLGSYLYINVEFLVTRHAVVMAGETSY